jgi:hypothetical protein
MFPGGRWRVKPRPLFHVEHHAGRGTPLGIPTEPETHQDHASRWVGPTTSRRHHRATTGPDHRDSGGEASASATHAAAPCGLLLITFGAVPSPSGEDAPLAGVRRGGCHDPADEPAVVDSPPKPPEQAGYDRGSTSCPWAHDLVDVARRSEPRALSLRAVAARLPLRQAAALSGDTVIRPEGGGSQRPICQRTAPSRRDRGGAVTSLAGDHGRLMLCRHDAGDLPTDTLRRR